MGKEFITDEDISKMIKDIRDSFRCAMCHHVLSEIDSEYYKNKPYCERCFLSIKNSLQAN